MKILIVEDDNDLLFLLTHLFKTKADLKLTTCETVDEARKLLDEGFFPDVALVDFRAAGNGTSVDLCRFISNKNPNCRLFLMSGICKEYMESATRDLVQIEDFLEKPFNIPVLMSKIMRAVSDGKTRTLGLTQYPVATEAQIDMLRELIERDPSDASVRQLLAFSLYTAGMFRDALRQYDIVREMGYTTFLCEYYAGHTCARMDRYSSAMDRWEAALKLAPNEETADRVRDRMSAALDIMRAKRKLTDTAPHPLVDD